MLSSFTVNYRIVGLLIFPQHQKQNKTQKLQCRTLQTQWLQARPHNDVHGISKKDFGPFVEKTEDQSIIFSPRLSHVVGRQNTALQFLTSCIVFDAVGILVKLQSYNLWGNEDNIMYRSNSVRNWPNIMPFMRYCSLNLDTFFFIHPIYMPTNVVKCVCLQPFRNYSTDDVSDHVMPSKSGRKQHGGKWFGQSYDEFLWYFIGGFSSSILPRASSWSNVFFQNYSLMENHAHTRLLTSGPL
jgi:hypothetical protein